MLLSSVAGGVAAVIAGATAAVVLLAPPAVTPTVNPNGNPGQADVSQSPARPAEFTAAGAFQTNFSGYTSGRYVVGDPDLVTTGYQQASIDLNPVAPSASASPSTSATPAGGAQPGARGDVVPREGRLVVYSAGAFDTREFTKAERLQIAGRTALLRLAGDPSAPATPLGGKYGCCVLPTVPTLAWQYLPNAWAVIYWSTPETAPTRAELIALAEDLPPAEPRAFPTAIHLKDMPRGYRLIAVSTRTSSYDRTNLSVVRLAQKPPGLPFTGPLDLDSHPSIVLTLGLSDPETSAAITKASCRPGTTACAHLLPDGQFFLQVESHGDRPLSPSELSQLLKSMTVEDPEDPSTWPAATDNFAP